MVVSKNRLIVARIISQADSTLGSSRVIVSIPHVGRRMPNIVRWSFLLFVFTLPFEGANLGVMSGALSIAKIGGYLFFLFYFLYHNPFSRKKSLPPVPHAMWWFLGYVATYALNGLFISEELVGWFFSRLLTLVQLMVVFWLASGLLEEKKTARSVLLIYSIASVILAVGMIFHLFGIEATEVAQGRVTALGDNPNTLAILMAMAAVIVIGLHINAVFTHFMSRILLLLLALPLLVAMVNTGSRGAILVLITGCWAYLLPYWRSKRVLIAIILGILGIVGTAYLVASSPDSLERWQQVYYEGNLAGRQVIFPTSIEMIVEQPIFGWHPVEFWYELGFRLGWGHERDAHNLFLHLLLEVGVVGTIPFLVGLWLCGRAAWRARQGELGPLPLALLLATLAGNMGHTGLTSKPFWLVLALTLAAGSTVSKGGGKRSAVLLVRRPSKTGIRRPY